MTKRAQWVLWLTVAVGLAISALEHRAVATPPSSLPEGQRLALQLVDSAGAAYDYGNVLLGWDADTSLYHRIAATSSGEIIVVVQPESTTFRTLQTTVGSVCEAVPNSQASGTLSTVIFNQSTTENLYCGSSASCTTANSNLIEPRTGRSYETTAVVYCIRGGSSDVLADSTEYTP